VSLDALTLGFLAVSVAGLVLALLAWLKLVNLAKLVKSLYAVSRTKLALEKTRRKLRKRYVVFAVLSEKKHSKNNVEKAIRSTFREYFGELLLIKCDPQLIYFDLERQRGVIRCTHLCKMQVLATLALIREIEHEKCLIVPIRVTGTIKKARKILYTSRKA